MSPFVHVKMSLESIEIAKTNFAWDHVTVTFTDRSKDWPNEMVTCQVFIEANDKNPLEVQKSEAIETVKLVLKDILNQLGA